MCRIKLIALAIAVVGIATIAVVTTRGTETERIVRGLESDEKRPLRRAASAALARWGEMPEKSRRVIASAAARAFPQPYPPDALTELVRIGYEGGYLAAADIEWYLAASWTCVATVPRDGEAHFLLIYFEEKEVGMIEAIRDVEASLSIGDVEMDLAPDYADRSAVILDVGQPVVEGELSRLVISLRVVTTRGEVHDVSVAEEFVIKDYDWIRPSK